MSSRESNKKADVTTRLEACLKERILIIDGAMGTMIQGYRLGEADYREGSPSWMWLTEQVMRVGRSLVQKHVTSIRESASVPPGHLNS